MPGLVAAGVPPDVAGGQTCCAGKEMRQEKTF